MILMKFRKNFQRAMRLLKKFGYLRPKVMRKPLRCALIVEILLNVLEVVMFVQPVEARVAAAKFK
jgi:hypothetical protein